MLWCALVCLLLGLWTLGYKRRQWALQRACASIPGLPGWPLIGNADLAWRVRSLSDLHRRATAYTDKFAEEGVCKFWFGNLLAVGVWDPEYIEVISNSPGAADKPWTYRGTLGDLHQGIVVCEGGALWRELRRPISRTLSRRLLDQDYHSVFLRKSRHFVEFLERRTGPVYDVSLDLGAVIFDIFGETHLGLEIDDVTKRVWNFDKHFKEYIAITFSLIIKYHYYFWKIASRFTKMKKVWDEKTRILSDFQRWVLEERKKCANNGKVLAGGVEYYPDFLLRRGREKNIPESHLGKELMDILLAGVDTSSTVASSLLVLLGMFPEVQERVYQEQAALLGDRDPAPEDLSAMGYLDMVIKETLRLIGPAGIFKSATQNVQIGQHTIPRGSIIFLFLRRLTQDPRYFQRPDHFHPEHFLPEMEASRPKYAFSPFGIGSRACPGSQYALQMLKMLTSQIVRKYRISTDMKFEDINLQYGLLMDMGHFPVSFTIRNHLPQSEQ